MYVYHSFLIHSSPDEHLGCFHVLAKGIETCTLYVKRIARPGSMPDTECSGLVHWHDPDGWDGVGGGRGLQDGEHMYTHGGFKSMHGKTNTMLYTKINNLNRINK